MPRHHRGRDRQPGSPAVERSIEIPQRAEPPPVRAAPGSALCRGCRRMETLRLPGSLADASESAPAGAPAVEPERCGKAGAQCRPGAAAGWWSIGLHARRAAVHGCRQAPLVDLSKGRNLPQDLRGRNLPLGVRPAEPGCRRGDLSLDAGREISPPARRLRGPPREGDFSSRSCDGEGRNLPSPDGDLPYNLPYKWLYKWPFNWPFNLLYNLPQPWRHRQRNSTSEARTRGDRHADYFSTRPQG